MMSSSEHHDPILRLPEQCRNPEVDIPLLEEVPHSDRNLNYHLIDSQHQFTIKDVEDDKVKEASPRMMSYQLKNNGSPAKARISVTWAVLLVLDSQKGSMDKVKVDVDVTRLLEVSRIKLDLMEVEEDQHLNSITMILELVLSRLP
jgi:hypothetical protein